jgi:periplasmic divalent cation tolerance protein
MKEYLLVMITAPESDSEKIAKALVKDGMAACVSIVNGIQSVYTWKGKIEKDAEDLLLVKTRAEHLENLTQKVLTMHSYEVPEVIALSLEAGATPYLQWIDQVIGKAPDK